MVKTLQKSSLEPAGRYPWNLACSIWDSCPSKFVQMMTLEWLWPIYGKVKFGNFGFSIGKSENLLIFENICSLWPETNWKNEHMRVLKVKVISWPGPKVIYIQNLKLALLRIHWASQSQSLFVSVQVQGNEILLTWYWSHDQDGMPCPYMVKTLQ